MSEYLGPQASYRRIVVDVNPAVAIEVMPTRNAHGVTEDKLALSVRAVFERIKVRFDREAGNIHVRSYERVFSNVEMVNLFAVGEVSYRRALLHRETLGADDRKPDSGGRVDIEFECRSQKPPPDTPGKEE